MELREYWTEENWPHYIYKYPVEGIDMIRLVELVPGAIVLSREDLRKAIDRISAATEEFISLESELFSEGGES
jgi:hypothetical protein